MWSLTRWRPWKVTPRAQKMRSLDAFGIYYEKDGEFEELENSLSGFSGCYSGLCILYASGVDDPSRLVPSV